MDAKPILMIPGPTEVHEDVLAEMGKPCLSHVSPTFVDTFGRCLEQLRGVFLASEDAQPFLLAGSGTLGWELLAANFIQDGDEALICNTGYFGDSMESCLKVYGANVSNLQAPIGGEVSVQALRDELQKKKYKLVSLCQVDTSTSVLTNVEALTRVVREVSPDTLVAVDGVCSIGGEELRFSEWDVDFAFTASQKAIGVPAGLMLMMMSRRAMTLFEESGREPRSYYASLKNWLPIMLKYEARQASYFATPAVNLVCALDVGLRKLLDIGMEEVFASHKRVGDEFRSAMRSMGLESLATTSPANTISAFKFPASISGPEFLKHVVGQSKVIIAGGLHKDAKATYFRVGHMGVSTLEPERADISRTIAAIRDALKATGHPIEELEMKS